MKKADDREEELEELTDGVVHRIAWEIRDGNHDPEQARRLLRHFLDTTETGQPHQKVLPERLLEFFRVAFAEYLRDPRQGRLERLLGLTRASKRPISKDHKHHHIAWDVLRERLKGSSLEVAADTVSKQNRIHESRVQDIWAEHKHRAFSLEWCFRGIDAPEGKDRWTELEIKRLTRIYGDTIKLT